MIIKKSKKKLHSKISLHSKKGDYTQINSSPFLYFSFKKKFLIFFLIIEFFLNLKISPITVSLDINGSINGLIRKLQQNYTQLENSGIFFLNASSIHINAYPPKNILYDDNSFFHSGNNGISGEYLEFDFFENLISISSYTIKSRYDCCPTKNWKVNGSINRIEWNTIDEVIEDLFMCSNGIKKTFFIKDQSNYRYIRFISTGTRCGHSDSYLNINLIEFFGSINLNLKFKSQNRNNNFNFSIFLFLKVFLIIY